MDYHSSGAQLHLVSLALGSFRTFGVVQARVWRDHKLIAAAHRALIVNVIYAPSPRPELELVTAVALGHLVGLIARFSCWELGQDLV